MEVNIKYKEIDNQSMVSKIVQEALDRNKRGWSLGSIIGNSVFAIDSLYKEDSKQIESVEIWRALIKICPQKLYRLRRDKKHLIIEQDFDATAMNKQELEQFIDILTTIKNQLE